MTRRYSFPKRLIAMLLSIVMIVSFLPSLGITASAAADSTVADAGTMDDWKGFFDPQNISSGHAGGIWTDKSVFTQATAAGKFPNNLKPADGNFLVALSAMGSNSVVVGSGTKPTDTVFVLDISGSMANASGAVSAMVKAANDAIRSLMAANDNNRVGVVLYSDSGYNSNVSGVRDGTGTVMTLLPLDHYTGVTWSAAGNEWFFIENNGNITTNIPTATQSGGNSGGGGCEGGGNGGNTQTVNQTPVGDNNGAVRGASVTVAGGTYIQGGLWQAWEDCFDGAMDGQAAGSRTPSIVLMSDGAPTFASVDFDDVTVGQHTNAHGNNSYDGDGFLAQLTASIVKGKVAAEYGTAAYMYTVGFALENISNTRDKAVASAVLDPMGGHRENMDDYWDTYNALAVNAPMNITVGYYGNNNTSSTTVQIHKSATAVTKNYVDKFFSASDASDLSSVFQNIVNEINLQSGYYPTRLDDNGTNFSGYVTFVDEIGTGMKVESVKGIVVGNTLYTGQQLASVISEEYLGTKGNPTLLGNELVRAVKTRMGITAETPEKANEIAWDLISAAYADGQLGIHNGVSGNYITWYGDANGNYLGPWTSKDTAAPEGAEYINACYAMLGTTTGASLASDMMYITIQVSHKIETDEQIVTFRIPASLLPTVTYRINVTLDDNNQVDESKAATIQYVAADPIRLVYEVGVNEDIIDEITITQYGTPAPAGSADAGKYYLYTNQWNQTAIGDFAHDDIAYSHFEASEQNEHYYFTENTPVYTSTDNGVTLTPATGFTSGAMYYYKHRFYRATGTANGEGEYAVRFETMNQLIDETVVQAAHLAGSYDAKGQLYIPQGTVRKNLHDHDATKGENRTGTFSEVREQIGSNVMTLSTQHHFEVTYLGNNGRITFEPATGISLHKQMATGAHAAGVKFPFTIELSSTANLAFKLRAADGTLSDYADAVISGNKVKVAIEAGQTLYVFGMQANVTYTVTEDYIDGYQQSSSSGTSGTTRQGAIQPVIFTNDVWDLSFLSVSKAVTYKGVSKPDILPAFEVTVTLKKANGQPLSAFDVLINGITHTTGSDGTLKLTVTDGEVKTLMGLPVGATYSVVESSQLPAGYTGDVTTASGTIDLDGEIAALKNVYTPAPVVIKDGANTVTITGTKHLVDGNNATVTDWNGMTFTVKLQHFVGGQWKDVSVTATVSQDNKTYSIKLPDNTFTSVGDHLVRVVEAYADLNGVTYDTVDREFRIKVTDDHANGKLVMTLEEIDATVDITTSNNTDWTATTDFTNIYSLQDATLALQTGKTLSGREMVDGEFSFTLSAVTTGAPMPLGTTGTSVTELNSKDGVIHFPAIIFRQAHVGETYVYRIEEVQGGLGGVTYDKSVYEITVVVSSNAEDHVVLDTTYTKVKDASGNAVSTAVTANTMTFANTYKASPISTTLKGHKTLIDRTPGAADTPMPLTDWDFSFTLSGSGEHQTKQNDDSGNIAFDTIEYTAAGSYTYTITENDTAYAGVTKDGAQYGVTVVVKDDGKGKLYIESQTITKNGTPVDHIHFENIYKAVPPTEPGGNTPGNGEPVDVILSGLKVLELANGKNLTRNILKGEFTFALKDAAGNVIQTVSNGNGTNANNAFTFSALTFDTLGVYEYTISEVKGIAGGIVYSNQQYTVKITVTDETKDGVMEVKVEGDASIVFTNRYDVQSTTLPMTASKHLSGRPMMPGEFSFTMTGLNGAPMPVGATGTTVDATNLAGGAIEFGTISYAAAGTYQYTIVENKPDGYVADANGLYNGIRYDENVYTVTVTVEDQLDGTLYAYVSKVEVGGAEATLDIHNRYEIHDRETVILGGNKVLFDATSETPKTVNDFTFQFQLTKPDGSTETVVNNGGAFQFADLTYTAPAREVFWIEEVAGSISGMVYDGAKYRVTIEITDNGLGGLDQSVVYEKLTVDSNGDPILDAEGNFTFDAAVSAEFENRYAAAGSDPVIIAGNKTFLGGRDIVDGEFSFVLTGLNGAPMPGNATVSNVGYIFTFEPITFIKEGTYVYTLVENIEGIEVDANGDYIKDGVKYDPTEFTVTVTVTDVGGKLTAVTDVKKTGGTESLTEYGFTNVFIPEAVSTTIEVDKVLNDLSEEALGEAGFEFALYRVDTQETLFATSDVEGKASFTLTFLGADVGNTYEYRLSEDDSAAIEGMTYDPTVYTIFITVNQDSATGALSLEVKLGTEALTGALAFVNTYDPVVPTTEPETTEPETTEPETTEPETTEPETTELETTEPETTEPETTEPETTEPETTEPETTEPETTEPVPDDENPKTDDAFALGHWSAMMGISAICLLAVLVLGKKYLLVEQ